MKVLIIGQCQGGNAKSWQDFLQQYDGFDLIHYVCRNQCQQDFTIEGENKKVFSLYNRFAGMGLIRKIWVKLVSTRILPMLVHRLDQKYEYDIIHFQGNYEPDFNFRLMQASNASPVLSIYGSDFYQRYINGGDAFRTSFEKVIQTVAHVLFNFEITREDFLKHIDVRGKSSVGCMGVDGWWAKKPMNQMPKDGVTRLLSARGMYAYNNIELLVDGFLELYRDNPNYELFLVNGYGWDEDVKNRILQKVNGVSNIKTRVGEWITDEEMKTYYDLCDYNFCIGSTDQLSVSIIYGFLHGSLNVLSPLRNYRELDKLQFATHYFLPEISMEAIREVLRSLPKNDGELMEKDRERAIETLLFSKRFENTKQVFDTVVAKIK